MPINDNLEKADKFLERQSTKIHTIINNFSKLRTPEPGDFIGEFHQTFRKNKPIPFNFFQLKQAEEIQSVLFYEASTTLLSKPGRHYENEKQQTDSFQEQVCKIFYKI